MSPPWLVWSDYFSIIPLWGLLKFNALFEQVTPVASHYCIAWVPECFSVFASHQLRHLAIAALAIDCSSVPGPLCSVHQNHVFFVHILTGGMRPFALVCWCVCHDCSQRNVWMPSHSTKVSLTRGAPACHYVTSWLAKWL